MRVFKDKGKFRRGYLADFTKEYFVIKRVLTNLPVVRYTLSGLDGEEIKGIYDNHTMIITNFLLTRKLL